MGLDATALPPIPTLRLRRGPQVGTGYSLSASETGLLLGCSGFSGVVPQLLQRVAAALAAVSREQVEAR